jgi:hypothetical protein
MSWNLALQINKLASITRVSGNNILIYNSTGTLLATFANLTGLFLGDASVGSGSTGGSNLTLPSYGSLTWAGLTFFPPSILTGGGANLFTRAGVAFNQNWAGSEKGQIDFALNSAIVIGGVPATTLLTKDSAIYQINNNSSTTSFRLPPVTFGVTPVGTFFIINNNGGANATITNFSAVSLHTLAIGATANATLLDSTAPNGTWEISSELPSTVNWGNTGATFSGSMSFTTNGTLALQSGVSNQPVNMGNVSAPFLSQLYDNGLYYLWDYGKRATTYVNPPVFNLFRADQTNCAGLYMNTSTDLQFVISYNSQNNTGTTWAFINGVGATAWTFPSDARLKNSIVDLPSQMDKFMKLRPVNYRFNRDTATLKYGFIAQDVKEVYPEFVSVCPKQNPEDEDYYGLNDNFSPILVQIVQEQQTKINSLEAQLASLKATVDALIAQKEILVV